MKNIIPIILILLSSPCLAQDSIASEKQAVIQVIESFFESLKTQDTVLYKRTLLTEGQVWRGINDQEPIKFDMRNFHEDLKSFDGTYTMEETAISYQVNIHRGMAMAWVPYTFKLNGVFSHCGVDVFTLIDTPEGWKIVSVAYTVDKTGCEELE